jgi:hypothetical protein
LLLSIAHKKAGGAIVKIPLPATIIFKTG